MSHDPFVLDSATLTLRFPVNLSAPDIEPWLAGNCGIAGVHSFAAETVGPHLLVTALVHGNEIAGAILLDRVLRAPPTPRRGRVTFALVNLDAYARFTPDDPTASRFVDEDFNRIWDESRLDGPGRSSELRRAKALRPLIDSADVVLDLHSMLWPSDPLVLTGRAATSAALGVAIGTPPIAVADDGHASGRRLIDYRRFAEPEPGRAALLVEAGQHWEAGTVTTMETALANLMAVLGLAARSHVPTPGRLAKVTRTVTAQTDRFTFLGNYRGGEVIPARNTLIALDGEVEIRTPHDDCLLVMPSPQTLRGHTAVRLARFA